jgi:hypothetical protein
MNYSEEEINLNANKILKEIQDTNKWTEKLTLEFVDGATCERNRNILIGLQNNLEKLQRLYGETSNLLKSKILHQGNYFSKNILFLKIISQSNLGASEVDGDMEVSFACPICGQVNCFISDEDIECGNCKQGYHFEDETIGLDVNHPGIYGVVRYLDLPYLIENEKFKEIHKVEILDFEKKSIF